METLKITKDGVEVEISVRKPGITDIDEAEKMRLAKIANLIKSGKEVLTKAELNNFLAKNNIWSEKDNILFETINLAIQENMAKMRKGGIPLSQGRKLAISITEKRWELVALLGKRQSYDDVTLEAQAEKERLDYLCYICTMSKNKDEILHNYWSSFEDFKAARGTDEHEYAISGMYEHLYGQNNEFEKRLPEIKWLSKHGFIDENLKFIDRSTKKFVDKEGKALVEVEEKTESEIELSGEITEEEPYIDDLLPQAPDPVLEAELEAVA